MAQLHRIIALQNNNHRNHHAHAGKTFTMEGGPRESTDGRRLSAAAGVIPRAIKQIFDTIEANNSDSNVKVGASASAVCAPTFI